jgi:hypothetical protein
MKNLLVSTALFIAVNCVVLNAQTVRLAANIPFEFQTGKTLMPAGEYTINRDASVLTVRARDGKHAVMVLTLPGSRHDDTPGTPVVLFHRYGDAYFLSGLWTPDLPGGVAVPQGSSEKLLARGLLHPETATIALTRQ